MKQLETLSRPGTLVSTTSILFVCFRQVSYFPLFTQDSPPLPTLIFPSASVHLSFFLSLTSINVGVWEKIIKKEPRCYLFFFRTIDFLSTFSSSLSLFLPRLRNGSNRRNATSCATSKVFEHLRPYFCFRNGCDVGDGRFNLKALGHATFITLGKTRKISRPTYVGKGAKRWAETDGVIVFGPAPLTYSRLLLVVFNFFFFELNVLGWRSV